ncbi:MAG: amidophosphoribosyltransferase, partial [Candidatus Bathyarchaeia archaeon]
MIHVSIKEHCGVYGIYDYNGNTIFPFLYWGLLSQNHRGHESHGFLTYDGSMNLYRNLGLIPEIKEKDFERWLKKNPGNVGIGNVRYGTSGLKNEEALLLDAHPFIMDFKGKRIGISYNGNIVNNPQLKRLMEKECIKVAGSSDVALLAAYLLWKLSDSNDLFEDGKAFMEDVEGAYSLTGITDSGELFVFRDPCGIRPFCMGTNDEGTCFAISSESVGLDINGFNYISEVKSGEVIVLRKDGVERKRVIDCGKRALCSFEFSYFARPDSVLDGTNHYVYEVRERFGRNLSKEYSEVVAKSDLIVSIPETANDAAYGLHEETGLRWERSLWRHRYITHRAFITPSREERFRIINRKVNMLGSRVKVKNIIVVEDSIVRGDTTRIIIKKLRSAGANKIHLFVTFPRIVSPCFYGIDMATYD